MRRFPALIALKWLTAKPFNQMALPRGAMMESRGVQQAQEKNVTHSVITGQERHGAERPLPASDTSSDPKAVGYGLPCSNCRAYYPSDLNICPVCKSAERVSPRAVAALPVAPLAASPDSGAQLEDERERFLRELKSQAFATHTQINAAATFRCVLEQNHTGDFEPAAVCHTCYSEMRQQADRLEAALHMDVKEAAQIVYAAVWADTSDPSKTYLNAAAALLSQMRQRAGIGLLLGSNSSLSH